MTRVERIQNEKVLRNKKLRKFIITTTITFFVMLITLTSAAAFLLYGPFPAVRELWVTTAMTTFNHQYLATTFFSNEEIKEIMDRNKINEPTENTNPGYIKVKTSQDESKDSGAGIQVDEIKGTGYKGYIMVVDDPSRVKIGTTSKMGKVGMKVDELVKKYNAIGGINAGGFADEEGKGWGGNPLGLLIEDGKTLQMLDRAQYNIVGFDRNNVLILGTYTSSEIAGMKLRDAISFKPFLIINGETMIKTGNGGWGIAPRTAIGQRRDGAVLLLTIDGRQLGSVGASLKDVQDIMEKYGAYNAANLDGGSSTTMVYDGKIINSPCSQYGPRYVPSAFIVK